MIWIWLWEIAACEGGDLNAIVAKAKAHRVGVMVKTHDGDTANPNGNAGPQLLSALRDASVPVRSWGYVYPSVDPNLQADFAAIAEADYIADVEVEWDAAPAQAKAFAAALRAKLPGRKLGYAPLPIVSLHNGGQYAELNVLDVACPQAYAGTGGRDAIGALEWTRQEWDAAFLGCNIEPAVYAADQPAAELRKAVAYCFGPSRQWGNGDVSIWSWQHMTAEHWAVVDEFTKGGNDMTSDEVLALLRTPVGAAAVRDAIAEPTEGYGPRLQAELVNDIQLPILAAIEKNAHGDQVTQQEIDDLRAKIKTFGAGV